MKMIVRTALCGLAGFVFFLPAHGQAVVDWMQAARGAQHLVIPRYSEPDKTLYAVIRVDKVYTEYEKRGFFRIGALPVAVLEGVTYEVKDPGPAAKNLARLRSWLGGDAARHVELRGVKLVASPTSRLEGGRLLFLDNNRWELADGVRLISGTNEFRAGSAMLQVGGAQAGEVVLRTTPPTTNTFLFGNLSEIRNATANNTVSK
ncbi:MAG: hypothetical protein ABSG78_14275 [Verrucomicrobiota bacterium]|jgi:hypothetical protein